MRFHELLAEDVKGPIVHTIRYRHLYHMTDHHGFAYSVDRNALRPRTQGYVSTTYDPKMNGFVGGNHADFKFSLDGKALARDYGCFKYDFHTRLLGWQSGVAERARDRHRHGLHRATDPLLPRVDAALQHVHPHGPSVAHV